jgi:hypothetical protein
VTPPLGAFTGARADSPSLPRWSGQELGSHSIVVVVCGGDVVVELGATAVGARACVAVVGSVGPLVAARVGSSSVCWRRSSPPVNPIRNTKVQTAAAWWTGIRWGGAVILTGPISPVVRFPNPNDARETARRRGGNNHPAGRQNRSPTRTASGPDIRSRSPRSLARLVERSGVGPQPDLVDHHRRHRDGVPGTTGPAPGASCSVPAHPVAVARTVHVWLEACLSGA